jgi:ligand-binding SRPBCC domain-containing protein
MTLPKPLRFQYQSSFDAPVASLWRFYMEPGALERLTPPLSWFRVIDPGEGVAEGSVLQATVGPWPVRQRWLAFHAAVRPEQSFVDLALESPFEYWVHLHQFDAADDNTSRLTDVVWFLPPRGVPRWAGRAIAALALRWTFWWRHRATRNGLRQRGSKVPAHWNELCADSASGGSA